MKDIHISVNFGKKIKRNLCSTVVPADYEGAAILVDNTNTKNEQIYAIAALRDFADAMEIELNRPENIREHLY